MRPCRSIPMTPPVKILTNNNMQYNFYMRFIASFSLLLLLAACGHNDQPAETAPGGNAPDTVPVFVLQADTLKKTVELPAELLPRERADLYARVQGFVRDMKVDIGSVVKKGQTLAVIEAPELNTRVAEARASLEAARAKWLSSRDTYERLYRASQAKTPGIVAPVDLERSRRQAMADSAGWAAAQQQAQSYKEVSGYLYVTAPFDGIITDRKADPGALAGANALLLTIQDNRTLRLRVAVPEIYTAAAAPGRSISFRVDAYPARLFTAVPARKTGVIDPTTRTELWEFEAANGDRALKAGAFAYARIPLQRGGLSFIVPPSAIATTQERKFVIKVQQGKAAWTDVRQGMTTDKGVEVFGSLSAGDTLLVKATDERKPGSQALWKKQ